MALKKIFLSLVLLASVFPASAQQIKLIETGRPQAFEYNNAKRTVGRQWGITFEYFAFDGRNFDALDSINALNKISEDRLIAKKGADWQANFNTEVEAELKKQDGMRKLIAVDDPQKLIGFEQYKCCKNKYRAYVFAQIEKDGQRPFYILQEYKANARKGKIRLIAAKARPIAFEYPENGIVN